MHDRMQEDLHYSEPSSRPGPVAQSHLTDAEQSAESAAAFKASGGAAATTDAIQARHTNERQDSHLLDS